MIPFFTEVIFFAGFSLSSVQFIDVKKGGNETMSRTKQRHSSKYSTTQYNYGVFYPDMIELRTLFKKMRLVATKEGIANSEHFPA